MNLVKWLRKNNQKVMAVVVIVVMLGFIGGAYIEYIGRRRMEQHKTLAYFADNQKITNYDLSLAGQELEILKILRADVLLRSIGEPLFPQTADLRSLLLAELLFSDRRMSPALIDYIKQTRIVHGYRFTDKQINSLYSLGEGRNIYWLLLKKEAQQVGMRISGQDLRDQLAKTIPGLFNGATYSQVIGELIRQQRVSENQILTAFGELLAVLEYAKTVCSEENVTLRQITHNASWDSQSIDVEFVKFDSALFAKTQNEPTEQEIAANFDKYKGFLPGTVTDQTSASSVEPNPYGFGYKLPDRISLEYIAVKFDDIKQMVTAPTQEETEDFYQKNIKQQFTEQVRSDPNDPNSPLTEQTKSYAEVASAISQRLLQAKVDSLADGILEEAKARTEIGLEDIDTEQANLSAEQFRQKAGDYKTTAEELSKKSKVKVYTGRTGLLSAGDIQADDYLGMLYIQPYGCSAVGLTRIVFAIDQLGDSDLGPFDVPKPRMYGNIGPIRDMKERIMVLARIIEAQKASEPESINQTCSKSTLALQQTRESSVQDVYSVKEKVIEDLRKLAAMDTAKTKAEEFIAQVTKDGWESTIKKFNEVYGQPIKKHEGEPNVLETPETTMDANRPFRLQKLGDLTRIPMEAIETIAVQCEGNPAAPISVENVRKEARLRDQLYSLIPPDSNTVKTSPFVMEFKPDMCWYCVKNISISRLEQEQYEKIKAMEFYKRDFVQSYSLAMVHFNPQNILKRMNYRKVKEDQQAADANAPPEPKGKL